MNVFISSVVKSLFNVRKDLKQSLEADCLFEVFISELKGSDYTSSIDVCLNGIEKCDMFIGILAHEYGYIPPKSKYDFCDGKNSISKIEFLYAQKLNKPMLIYIKEGDCSNTQQKKFIQIVENIYEGTFVTHLSDFDTSFVFSVKRDIVDAVTNLIRGVPVKHLNIPKTYIFNTQKETYHAVAQSLYNCISNVSSPRIVSGIGKTVCNVYEELIQMGIDKVDNLPSAEFHVDCEYFGYDSSYNMTTTALLDQIFIKRLSNKPKLVGLQSSIKTGQTIDSIISSLNTEICTRKINYILMSCSQYGETMGICPQEKSIQEILEMGASLEKMDSNSVKLAQPTPPIPYCLTIGIGNAIRMADEVSLVLTGQHKSEIVRRLLLENINPLYPASLWKINSGLRIYLDKDSASQLPPWIKSIINDQNKQY